jgi:hypothetical protein
MKRIVLATPCRDSLGLKYVGGLFNSFGLLGGRYEIVPAVNLSTCIHDARGELVEYAKSLEAAEIIFVDSDIGWVAPDLERLLSHDVDIVGADYCKRIEGNPPQMTARAADGVPGTGDNSLIECTSLPAGFLRIKMDVFRAMFDFFPERRFLHADKSIRCEYFPTGLVEPYGWKYPSAGAAGDLAEQISEDVGFCRLARAAGFTLWCDIAIKLRHHGDIGFPAVQLPI